MNYFTFREASEITGLNEATIRRLSKKPESKPYVQMKKGKRGTVYTIQADYLFGIYPRLKLDNSPVSSRMGSQYGNVLNDVSPEIAALLAAKDAIIQYLKDEAAYLRDENINLQEEIRSLRRQNVKDNTRPWPTKLVNWVTELWQSKL